MERVAIVGCGAVGSSWALVFARAGFEVAVYDSSAQAVDGVIPFARAALNDWAAVDRVGTDSPDAILARLHPCTDLAQALVGVDYVQESVPEHLGTKTELYRRLDALAAPHVALGSSASGLPASSFTKRLRNARRCLVVHPINPPHLIPLVELVPAPWTAPAVVDQVQALMLRVGQSPIRLSREIRGFVANRLQSAMLAEAFKLVEDGICSVNDVDKAVADGLGLRWCFMGPFETIDLNAAEGVTQYCQSLGLMYYGLAREQSQPRRWSPELVAQVEQQRRVLVQAQALPQRRSWRDKVLVALISAKRQVFSTYGN